MIRNIKTNNYIKFNSSHFKNLYNKQLVGSDHYFLSKDVKAISSAYKKLKKNTNHQQGGYDDDTCPICLVKPNNEDVHVSNGMILRNEMLTILPCKHRYCKSCLNTFLKSCKSNLTCKCPLCRGAIRGPVQVIDELVEWYNDIILIELDVECRLFKNANLKNPVFELKTMHQNAEYIKNDIIYYFFKPFFDNFIFRHKYNDTTDDIVDELKVEYDSTHSHEVSSEESNMFYISFKTKKSSIISNDLTNILLNHITKFNNGTIHNEDKFVVYGNDTVRTVRRSLSFKENKMPKTVTKQYYYHISPTSVSMNINEKRYLLFDRRTDGEYVEAYRPDDMLL